MACFWSGSVAEFLATSDRAIRDRLNAAHIRGFRTNEVEQFRAWDRTLAILRQSLPRQAEWRVILEFEILRLGRRIDVVLLLPCAILVLEFKVDAASLTSADREQVEDYALDLQDFHAESRRHPIIPILVATEASPGPQTFPLPINHVAAVMDASAATLSDLLIKLESGLPRPVIPLYISQWEHAPYRPVPTIIEAARTLYSCNGVPELAAARADADNLTRTTQAILSAVSAARDGGRKAAIFVTGIPGAGKTLCGLNAVFGAGRAEGAVFLTGNPSLVHVLREALARDAGVDIRAARQRMESQIQALPKFRDAHLATGEIPAEHVAVVDEAQRCWARAHAMRKTQDRRTPLTDSEPGHLLDIMDRHPDWAALVCLVGQGQEIHTGEGGLPEWGEALRSRPHWQVISAPGLNLPCEQSENSLHLSVPIRAIRGPQSSPWVEAVLAGNAAAAHRISANGVPYLITRDLEALRAGLRGLARGSRRAGLVASSGAARLRAVGLGVELPHMEPSAVARWFLDRWPDVRASDALEVAASEFSCQGLELDVVGLCWDGDFVPGPGGGVARQFRGKQWQILHNSAAVTYRRNTYRVLLTRARYETILFVPRGDSGDATRDPVLLDGIAAFLVACGAVPLAAPVTSAPAPVAMLL